MIGFFKKLFIGESKMRLTTQETEFLKTILTDRLVRLASVGKTVPSAIEVPKSILKKLESNYSVDDLDEISLTLEFDSITEFDSVIFMRNDMEVGKICLPKK